jgi:hypothetical protein
MDTTITHMRQRALAAHIAITNVSGVVFVVTGDYDHPVRMMVARWTIRFATRNWVPVLRLKVSMLACVVIISGPSRSGNSGESCRAVL